LMCSSANKNRYEKGNLMKSEKVSTKETFKEDLEKTEDKTTKRTNNLHIKEETHNKDGDAINDDTERKKVNQSILSRDEAIKLSTNASGTLQPRMSTKTGSKLLIKHEETDSTFKDDGKDQIRPRIVRKVSNSMSIKKKEFEQEESDPGFINFPTAKPNESAKWGGKQTVIPTFGSKDPVMKKMVYNQYREMLRKYTQSSRL
jgi:preprotein translocase subunit SecD